MGGASIASSRRPAAMKSRRCNFFASRESEAVTASLFPAVKLQKRSAGDEMILISCGEVRRELSNYIDDEVTPEVRPRIDEHVRFCPGCKAVYDGVRNVLTLLGSGDIIELPRGFSLRLFERLRAVRDERAFPSPRNMSQNLRAKLDQFVHSEEAGQAEGAHQIPLSVSCSPSIRIEYSFPSQVA